MSQQIYKYAEKVLVDGEICTIHRTKHTTLPSGTQSWRYQAMDSNGILILIDGESWLYSQEIKKMHEPCGLTFKELMEDLKNVQQEWE